MAKILLLFVLVGALIGGVFLGFNYFKPDLMVNRALPKLQKPNFNVIIVGWDGISWDRFQDCYSKTNPNCPDGLPNIKELSGNGKGIFLNVVGNGFTHTLAGWPQVLTGYNSGFTGVVDYRSYKAIPKGATIFEKAKKAFGKDDIAALFVGSGGKVSSSCSGEKKIVRRKGDPDVEIPEGGPYCYTREVFDEFFNESTTNQQTGDKVLSLLDKYKDKTYIMYSLFLSPDEEGHTFGADAPEYMDGLKDSDIWLKKIVDKLKEDGTFDKTYIYVISDHGWDDEAFAQGDRIGAHSHDNGPFGIFASNDDTIIRPGDRRDLAPTILKKMGLSLGEDKELGLPAVDGIPMDTLPTYSSVPEGGLYMQYEGAASCTSGTNLITLDKFIQRRDSCLAPQGGKDVKVGFCSVCGNNVCEPPENQCNCSRDCK